MEDEDEHVRDSAYYALEAGPYFTGQNWGWRANKKGGTKTRTTKGWRCVLFVGKNCEDYKFITRWKWQTVSWEFEGLPKYLGGRVAFLCGCFTISGSKKASWSIRFNCHEKRNVSFVQSFISIFDRCDRLYIEVLKALKKRACISSRKHISTQKTHDSKHTRPTQKMSGREQTYKLRPKWRFSSKQPWRSMVTWSFIVHRRRAQWPEANRHVLHRRRLRRLGGHRKVPGGKGRLRILMDFGGINFRSSTSIDFE